MIHVSIFLQSKWSFIVNYWLDAWWNFNVILFENFVCCNVSLEVLVSLDFVCEVWMKWIWWIYYLSKKKSGLLLWCDVETWMKNWNCKFGPNKWHEAWLAYDVAWLKNWPKRAQNKWLESWLKNDFGLA